MEKNNSNNYFTYFDSLVSDKNLQMLKVMIPFMPPQGQKFLSVMVKVTELKNTINLINNPKVNITDIHMNKPGNNLSDMIDAIRGFLSPEDAEMLDMFMTIMELGKMSGDEQNDMLRNYMEMFSGMT